MPNNINSNIRISGPFSEYSAPYGKVSHSLDRKTWYVFRLLSKNEQKTEFQKITGERSLGVIVRYKRHPRRFIISQLFPAVSFNSLKKCVNFLVENEGKLVFCT